MTSDKLAPEVITQLETITDAEPTPGSVKPVQSGGVFREIAKQIMTQFDGRFGEARSLSDYNIITNPKYYFNTPVTNGVVTIKSETSVNYRVCYSQSPLKKGAVIHFTANVPSGRGQVYGASQSLPEELVGFQIDHAYASISSSSFDDYYIMPYDGYFFYGYNNQYWSDRLFTVVEPNDKIVTDIANIMQRLDIQDDKIVDSAKIAMPITTPQSEMTTTVTMEATIDEDGRIVAGANNTYRVYFYPKHLKKGTILHFNRRGSISRARVYGFTTTDPTTIYDSSATLNGFENFQLEDVIRKGGTDHDYDIVVPYDSWMFIYQNTQSWINEDCQGNATTIFSTWYMPDTLVEKFGEVDERLSAVENGKMDSVKDDCTKDCSWLSSSTDNYPAKNDDTQIVTTADGAIVSVISPVNGGRFGILLQNITKGNYLLEFDYTAVDENGDAIEIGSPIGTSSRKLYGGNHKTKWAALNTVPFIEDIEFKETVENNVGHYCYIFKSTEETSQYFYRSLYVSGRWNGGTVEGTVGDVITITNFKLIKIINDISEWYDKEKETIDKDDRLQYMAKQARSAESSQTSGTLGLLHYSDLHGDDIAVEELVQSMSELQDYIHDVVCTGDVVHYYADSTTSYPQGVDWWRDSGLAEKSLFVLGNHDNATVNATEYDIQEGSAAWDGKGIEYAYRNYYADYFEGLGITLPSGHETYYDCYWYKDYASQKIRVIGVDCMHRFDGILEYDSTNDTWVITQQGYKNQSNIRQELWLWEKLQETLLGSGNPAEGYSVVFLCHYPLDDISGINKTWDDSAKKFIYNQSSGRVMNHKTGDVTNFHWYLLQNEAMRERFCMRSRNPQTGVKLSTNNIGNIIMQWKNNGGKYVAWICGHFHRDLMFYPAKYPELLIVGVDQTGSLRGSNTYNRNLNNVNQNRRLCANFYSIDTTNGLFKIVRVGGTRMDRFMIPQNYMCYDYINKKVISEG